MRDDNKKVSFVFFHRENERERTKEMINKEENFLASGKKVNFWDPKHPSSLKFMWITLLPFLRHRPTKASSSFVPEALSFVIVRSAVFWARFRILRGRRYLLVAFSSVSVTRHRLCISLFLKSYSSLRFILSTEDRKMIWWISLLKKERTNCVVQTTTALTRERYSSSKHDRVCVFLRLLSEWWILIRVVL